MSRTSQVTRGARRGVPGRVRAWLFRLGLGLLAIGGAIGLGWSLGGSMAQAAETGGEPASIGLVPVTTALMSNVGRAVGDMSLGDMGGTEGDTRQNAVLQNDVLSDTIATTVPKTRRTVSTLMSTLGHTVEDTAGKATAEMEPVTGKAVGTLVCGHGCSRPRDAAPASPGDPIGSIASGVVRTSSAFIDDVTRTAMAPMSASRPDPGEATTAVPGLAHRLFAVFLPALGAVTEPVTEPGSAGPPVDAATDRPLDAGEAVACLPRRAADHRHESAAARAAGGHHTMAQVDSPRSSATPDPAGESLPKVPCAPASCPDAGCAPGANTGRTMSGANGGAAAVLAGAVPSFTALPSSRPAGEVLASPAGTVLEHITAPD